MKKKVSTLLSVFLCMLLSLSLGLSFTSTISVQAASTLTTYSGNTVTMSGDQIKGTEDGYSYELWNQNDQGTTSMILGSGGSYQCTWSGIENVLFRRGVDFDCTKTYKELGNISVEYEAEYNNPSQNTYLCVYGWTRSPLIEYYIVDSWGSWRPPGSTSIGQITVDGGTYDVYETDRVNQPSIDGTTTFKQYWSVRTSKRTSGTISVSKHFEEWEKLGLETGKLYEAALNVEGYQSSGTANVTKNIITVGGEIQDTGSDTDSGSGSSSSATTDESGYYYHSTFESSTDDWVNRGDASIATTSQVAFAGSQSLAITGRTDSWNGTARTLSTSTFQPGQTYSFSTMVMQNATSSEDFRLTLQYDDASGETNYATVASGTGANGEWVQLANTSYTIPSGATNMLLYVETSDSTTNFYIDEAIGAPGGTTITPQASATTTTKDGDTNADGTVDTTDVANLQDYLIGKTTTISNADMNSDGIVNGLDLSILREKINNGTANATTNTNTDTSDNTSTSSDSTIDPTKPMVAISFDDGAVGSSADSTSVRILNALNNSGFHATFFYVGSWIQNSSQEEEVKMAYNMGMEIANHTQTHPYLTNLSASEIRSEYDTCYNRLESIIGTAPSKLLRLPYLASNDTVLSTLYDVPMITCALDTQDWNGASKDDIVNTVKTAMANGTLDGEILLAHETYSTTAAAMEELCPYLKENGWQIVTISEMFEAKGKTLSGGQIYTKVS